MVVTYGCNIAYLRNFQEYEKQKIQIEIQISVRNFDKRKLSQLPIQVSEINDS